RQAVKVYREDRVCHVPVMKGHVKGTVGRTDAPKAEGPGAIAPGPSVIGQRAYAPRCAERRTVVVAFALVLPPAVLAGAPFLAAAFSFGASSFAAALAAFGASSSAFASFSFFSSFLSNSPAFSNCPYQLNSLRTSLG